MSSGTATPAPSVAPPCELAGLPHVGLRGVAGGLQRHFRPGAHRGPLRRLGERCVVDLPRSPTMLITSSPEDAKAILTRSDGALSLGRVLKRLTPHPVLFGDDSLIFLEGDAHVRERRRLGPAFHGQMMRSFEPAIVAIARQRVEGWPTGEPVEFVGLAQEFVLDVMRSIVFGVADSERMQRLDRAMRRYCHVAESDGFLAVGVLGVVVRGRWSGYPPLERAAAAVDRIVLEEIAERRRAGSDGRDDCLTMLLATVGQEGEARPDDATLARDLRGLMLAGYETTAITLGWIAEMLVHHPAVLARLQAGVDAGEVDYLEAVISEVMRLRPTFPFTARRATRDVELNGVRVPKGTMVVVSIMAVHERADLYDEPLAFRPERFLEARPGTYTWLSFGGGPHRCLGASLAVFESRVLLRTLLERRTLAAADSRPERARRNHPMLIPEHGGRVVLGRR